MGQDNATPGGAGPGPADASGYAGMNQGAQGIPQGFHGSVRGQAVGPMEGMQRMSPQTAPGAGGGMDPRLMVILKALAAVLAGGGGRGGPPGPPTPPPMAGPPMR